MSDDFEKRLSDTLKGAVPTPPADVDRVRNALRYARRTRRAKATFAVSAVAALVVAGTVVPNLLPSQQNPDSVVATPKKTLSTPQVQDAFTCSEASQRTLEQPPHGRVPAGAVLARICPAPSRGAQWQAPADPLLSGLDRLAADVNGLPVTRPADFVCGELGPGPSYTMTFQYADGRTLSVLGDAGVCNDVRAGSTSYQGATQLLQRFLGQLQAQRSSHPSAGRPQASCPRTAGGARPGLIPSGRDLGLVSAVICRYSYTNGVLTRSGAFTADQVAIIDADYRSRATTNWGVYGCVLEGWGKQPTAMIVGKTAWGDSVVLAPECNDLYRSTNPERPFLVWMPSPRVSRMFATAVDGP